MAINQAVLNLALNLRQGVQQQQARALSLPMGCPGPSTSKGTREIRKKRKHDDLEDPIDEVRSDEEISSSDEELEDCGDSESCGEDRDEANGNSDDDDNDTTGLQSHPRARGLDFKMKIKRKGKRGPPMRKKDLLLEHHPKIRPVINKATKMITEMVVQMMGTTT